MAPFRPSAVEAMSERRNKHYIVAHGMPLLVRRRRITIASSRPSTRLAAANVSAKRPVLTKYPCAWHVMIPHTFYQRNLEISNRRAPMCFFKRRLRSSRRIGIIAPQAGLARAARRRQNNIARSPRQSYHQKSRAHQQGRRNLATRPA